jgi:hypothetical protein
MARILYLALLLLSSPCILAQNAWINEIHYDNVGTDANEVVEIVIENPGSYSLSDFEVHLYSSGSGGAVYDNNDLGSFAVGDTEGNYTFYYWYMTQLQNGPADGLSLSYLGTVISGQFLSYEGSFTAIDGPAAGLTSVDIGVSEGSSTADTQSLQLTGSGTQYSDFYWLPPDANTVGGLNNGQSFCLLCPRNFKATAVATDQIDLSWLQNGNGDDVMIAFNTTATFGTPSDGTVYSPPDPIPGGGTVIYNGSATSTSHTGLTPSTHYFYMAWSVDAPVNYSPGVPADAITFLEANAGDIVITEIMQNPSDVVDAQGEWFELFNASSSDIDINGWTISDNDIDSHTINNGGSLIIPAGGFLVLGRNSDIGSNGGVPVDYQYASFILANSADEIILTSPAAVEIDRIEYDGGPDWPDPAGASMIYTGLASDDNDDGAEWITSYKREAAYSTASSDLGSPGINGLFQNMISSTVWSGNGNWSEGSPPAGGTTLWSNGSPGEHVDVIIDGTVTVDMPIATPALCGALNLLSGQSLTVDPSNGLIINGSLIDEGGTFLIETDAEVEVR